MIGVGEHLISCEVTGESESVVCSVESVDVSRTGHNFLSLMEGPNFYRQTET